MENNEAKTQANETLLDQIWENSTDENEALDFFKGSTSKTSNKIESIINSNDDIIEEEDDNEDEDDENNETEENKTDVEKKSNKTTEEEKSRNNNVDEEEGEGEGGENEQTDKHETDDSLKLVLNVLVEEGVVDEKLTKDKEISPENFLEIVTQQTEINVNKKIDELFEGLDEDGKRYLQFIKDGGKTSDFLQTLNDNSIPDIDIEDESEHENVIIYYKVQVEGLTEEEAKEEYEILKEGNKAAKRAKIYYQKLKENETKEKDNLIKKQAEIKKQQEENAKKFVSDLKTVLSSKKEILGVPLSEEDKTKRLNSIMKVLPNEKISNFQKRLNEAVKNPEKLILLDKILDKDFNFDWIKVKEKTKVASTARQQLTNLKKGNKDLKNINTTNSKKSLADYFN
jgi:hypothetical protein